MKRPLVLVGLIAVLCIGVDASSARRSIELRDCGLDMETLTEASAALGPLFVLTFTPPSARGAAVDRVLLELRIDVASMNRNGYLDPAPLLEVALLDGWTAGSASTGRVVRRPVAIGTSRRVIVDITPLVRLNNERGLSSCRLVVGSLTGLRQGDFKLHRGDWPGAGFGRIRVLSAGRAN